MPTLLPLLDGEREIDDVVGVLGEPLRPAVGHAIAVLAAHGLLCEGPSLRGLPAALRETAEWLSGDTGAVPAAVAAALAEATVTVVGRSRRAGDVRELLEASGVQARSVRRWRDAEGSLVVAAPGVGEAGALFRLNRRALRRGTTWLPAHPYDGRIAAVGPLIVPGETPCFHCFLLRRAAAVDYGQELLALERRLPAARSSAALDRLTAELTVLQAVRWLGVRDPSIPGVLLVAERSPAPRITRHEVLRVPRCPVCSGVAEVAAPLPWDDLPLEAAA